MADKLTIDCTAGTSTLEPLTEEEQAQFEADSELGTGLLWQQLRDARDGRLAACDWTQLPDATVDPAAWATYRQALRDLPEDTDDPADPPWPDPPS